MTMQTIIKRNMKVFLFVNPPRKKNASTNANTNADARQMTTHASQKEPNNYSDSSIPKIHTTSNHIPMLMQRRMKVRTLFKAT